MGSMLRSGSAKGSRQAAPKKGPRSTTTPAARTRPAWTEEVAKSTTWTRSIGALGGSLGAIETSNGEVTLQLADMHGDVVATAD